MDHHEYNIAWVFSSPDHHKFATSFFDHHYGHYSSTLLNMTYSTGKIGQHHVVVASKDPATTPLDMENIVDRLLQKFPSIRAGFLVNPEATAPAKGPATVGSVVVGTRPNLQSGIIHFDTMETRNQGRLVTTYEPRHVPEAVAMAVEDLLTEKGRQDWQKVLEVKGRPIPLDLANQSHQAGRPQLQRKAFRGVIASSTQALDDEVLVDRIREENHILCFDTTAASMKSSPLVVVAGVANYIGSQQSCLPSVEVCNNVISYLSCLTQRIDAARLGPEPPLANLYKYKPFDLKQPGFRLLRLEKGSENDPIHCQLSQAYLQDKDDRQEETRDDKSKDLNSNCYEALSYCWGENPRLCHMITVDGKVLFITENLLKALKHLRYDDEDRTIWIDALCIDQSNIRERGHQVGWMTKVYEHASRVLCWLGEVGYITGSLISLLKSFEDKVPPEAWDNWSLNDPEWSIRWQQAQDDQKAYDYPEELKFLMTNPWFTRVWILQEVAKARQASIGCSWGWVDTRAFAMAPALLGVQLNSQCQAVIDIMPGLSKKSSWWAQKPNICTLLWRFRDSQASDPRDRLYALMGLASDQELIRRKITADYTKTQEAVVEDIADFLFDNKMIPLTTFSGWNIADLQMRIPNLSAIALEKVVLSGLGLNDMPKFMERQNSTIPLSEALINYTWCTQSPLMHHFKTQSAFQEVVLGVVPIDSDMRAMAKAEFFKKERVEITSKTIQALIYNDMDPVQLVLRLDRVDIKVTEAFVEYVASQVPESFMLLLDQRRSEVKITYNTIRALKNHGLDIIMIVKNYPPNNIEITSSLIEEADEQGPESLQLLLEKGKVTDDIVRAVAKNRKAMMLLLNQRGEEVKITEDLMNAANRQGTESLELLLDRGKVTVDFVKAVAGREMRGFSSKMRGFSSRMRGFSSEMRGFSSEMRGFSSEMKGLRGEAKGLSGEQMMRLLLDRRGEDVKITEDVLKAAASNRYDGDRMMELLLNRRGEEVQVREETKVQV